MHQGCIMLVSRPELRRFIGLGVFMGGMEGRGVVAPRPWFEHPLCLWLAAHFSGVLICFCDLRN